MGKTRLFGPDMVNQTMEKIKVILERLKIAQSHKNSHADMRRKELEIEVGDWLSLL